MRKEATEVRAMRATATTQAHTPNRTQAGRLLNRAEVTSWFFDDDGGV
jgi:hypothetical protein